MHNTEKEGGSIYQKGKWSNRKYFDNMGKIHLIVLYSELFP